MPQTDNFLFPKGIFNLCYMHQCLKESMEGNKKVTTIKLSHP